VCIVGSPRIYIDRAAPGRAVVVARRMHRQPPIAVDVQNMNTAMSIDRNVCTGLVSAPPSYESGPAIVLSNAFPATIVVGPVQVWP